MKIPSPRSQWLAVTALMLIAVGMYRQLLHPEGFESRDHQDFYLRVTQYELEFRSGHWPQTLPEAIAGGGHAFPRFYPPVSHSLAAAASMLVKDPVWGTHLSVLVAVLLSGGLQALLLWRITRSAAATVLGTLVFLAFPYRFLQIYLRGAFAETWFLALTPAVALGALTAVGSRTIPRGWPVAIALLTLSHTIMTLWTLPVILALTAFAAPPGRRRPYTRNASLVTMWGLGLSAFSLVPLAFYLPGVRVMDAGLMRALPKDLAFSTAIPYLGFPAPPVTWSLLGLAVITGVGLTRATRRFDRDERLLWGSAGAVVLLSGMIAAPAPVWTVVPLPLRMIQFPFRLLGPIAFFGSLLVGMLAARHQRGWLRGIWWGIAVLVALGGWRFGGLGTVPRTVLGRDLPVLLAGQYPDRGLTVAGEYLPRGTDPTRLARAVRGIREMEGEDGLIAWDATGRTIRGRIRAERPAHIALPLVAYDFHDVRLVSGPSITVGEEQGLLAVGVEAGTTEIQVRRRWPPALWAGLLITAVAVLLLLVPRTGFPPRRPGA